MKIYDGFPVDYKSIKSVNPNLTDLNNLKPFSIINIPRKQICQKECIEVSQAFVNALLNSP